ncbi:MAG: glycine betaine/proline transport system ATP-binding protein [Gammaproteobacteria bacterium]|jgi:glycine betaine/proline transport system ATP-binding protein|nr:glycine betaine/proline transport system ATP-binding protein [Gammaproteobacteria bacterium]
MTAAVEFQNVDILFARNPGRDGRRAIKEAIAALDAGGTRTEIQEKYGVIVGVAGASLSVARGEISVLMGLSGSGKSTLLRAANGLNPVTRGHVLVRDGESAIDVASCDTAQMRRVRRERVAMVFQQFGLLPWRTVRENVGFGLELRGDSAATRKTIVDEKLELVGLSQWAERYVSELSGGMQQRVGLARAFATDADILLMDEPFSALDPLIRGKLQDELLALQERVKKTILFVSHDLDEALRLGDRISILQNGRIIQTGTAEDIVLAPADDYVAEFVRHMNPLDVLTGSMIMNERANMVGEGNLLWLDDRRRYALSVSPSDEALDLRLDGVSHALHHIHDDAGLANVQPGLVVAPASFSLQSIIQLRQSTGHPVLLSEGGKIIGVCSETEIIRALAGSRQ